MQTPDVARSSGRFRDRLRDGVGGRLRDGIGGRLGDRLGRRGVAVVLVAVLATTALATLALPAEARGRFTAGWWPWGHHGVRDSWRYVTPADAAPGRPGSAPWASSRRGATPPAPANSGPTPAGSGRTPTSAPTSAASTSAPGVKPTAPAAVTPPAPTGPETVPAPTNAVPTAPAPPSTPPSNLPSTPPSNLPSIAATAPHGGGCARSAGAAPSVRTTQVSLGTPVIGYGGESDTEPLPMALAARPDGGSWLAWLGTDQRVHVAGLDCADRLVGAPAAFSGIDLQDVIADPNGNGGVVLVTRPGSQGSGKLCGGTSSPAYTMWMVRFDAGGSTLWERQVTNLSSSLGGYDNGARFVWWYQHHGRLATDGSTFAAYFGVAITVQNGSCVDIHEGDRMQVVDGAGALLSGHDSFAVGCSHAWTSRLVWDPRTKHYVMVCATDNDCRIAQPNPYRTVAAGTCDGTLFGGDLVLANGSGYWTAWSQGGRARLEHFTTGAADRSVSTSAATSHPHLVGYSGDKMLLAWETGSSMTAQVYDATNGAAVGGSLAIGVRDHSYQAFKAYPDGSVAYPAAGASGASITIARVMPVG